MRNWNLSNIPPDLRALAEESAKRAGLSLGAWLSRTIHRQRDSEAAERVGAADGGAPSAPVAGAPARPAAAAVQRFLPTPLPTPRDIPLDALRVSRLHGETGLIRGLAEASAGDAPAVDADMPIIARPATDGDGFEIVTGIAGWQAARDAGGKTLPVQVLDLSDHELIRLILIEILTTTRIPAIAEAESFRWLLQRGDVSEDDLMEISGSSRQDLRARIALLSLPAPVLGRLDDGSLSIEAAQTLVDAVDGDTVSRIAIAHDLPAEQVRALVALTNRLAGGPAAGDAGDAERELSTLVGAEVAIEYGDDGTPTLRIGKRDGSGAEAYPLRAAAVEDA